MIPLQKKLAPFLTMKTVQSDKFKTERFTLISRFVFNVLMRGCKNYPTQRELNIRLDELYSATVSSMFFYGGGMYKIGFTAEMLGDEYTSENIFENVVDLVFDIFNRPFPSIIFTFVKTLLV